MFMKEWKLVMKIFILAHASNERNFYNKLLHYGKKMNKKQKGKKIMYVNSF